MGSPPFHWHYADLDQTTSSVYQLRGRSLFFVLVLFAIILLATLLFFYARWVCLSSPLPPQTLPRIIRGRRGLDAAFIAALPVLLYGSLPNVAESDECCCICLSLFEEDDKIKMLPECNHCFHSDCVDSWLLTQSSCPLCRSSLAFHHQPQIAVVP